MCSDASQTYVVDNEVVKGQTQNKNCGLKIYRYTKTGILLRPRIVCVLCIHYKTFRLITNR